MIRLVFGIDIINDFVGSGSVPPRFSLIRINEGKMESEERGISLYRVLRFVEDELPEILAVDSIQEVAKNTKDFYAFLAALPPQTKLVQVTGDGVRMESLLVAASRHNLKFDKTNPMEEAKASALVASFGGWYDVALQSEVERRKEVAVQGMDPGSYVFEVVKPKPARKQPSKLETPIQKPKEVHAESVKETPEFSTIKEPKKREKTADILLSALNEYKAERKKELGANERP